MSDLLIRNSEVSLVLDELGRCFSEDVADIIQKGGVKTVHHAVVSSQFDADRLDYMRRDKLMTGTQHAGIDCTWLISNLEIGSVKIGLDDTPLGEIETFVLGPKAVHAAEAYVLGLFQLYPTVYFHKATRGAEKLFTELLVKVVNLVRDDTVKKTGLPETHPLVRFARNPEDLDSALMLDDTVIWGSLAQLGEASDQIVAEFSTRLRDRKLFKCYDIRSQVTHAIDPKSENTDQIIEVIDKCCASIEKKLNEWATDNDTGRPRLLIDNEERSPYKSVNESKGPLDRINVRTDGGVLVDLKERSSVVAALKTYKLFRVYIDRTDADVLKAVMQIVEGEIKTCRM
jgi:HD superfamily phosphohydrolase